jgi:CheY-like chemotaxis protein
MWPTAHTPAVRRVAFLIVYAAAPVLARHHSQMVVMARILIVDDDAASASSLVRILQDSGYGDTRVVRSAATALRAAIDFDPGIIFVDIELPDMTGYDVALLLHQHPHRRLQHMRLIALTDNTEHLGRERARMSGFERYLVKPVSAAALLDVLSVPRRH